MNKDVSPHQSNIKLEFSTQPEGVSIFDVECPFYLENLFNSVVGFCHQTPLPPRAEGRDSWKPVGANSSLWSYHREVITCLTQHERFDEAVQ